MDNFVDIDGEKKLSNQYWTIANQIWTDIFLKFPKTVNSLKLCIDQIKQQSDQNIFDLIYGQVQSGKSRCILILVWFAMFMKVDIIPVVMTINLSSVRQDFVNKASRYGELNQQIERSIQEHFPEHPEWISQFQLSAIDFQKYRQQSRIRMGELLVLIQNETNFTELIKLYQDHCSNGTNRSLMIIIDEMHKMVTIPIESRLTGLKSDQSNNQTMLYWLYDKAQARKIYLLGVTATGLRIYTDIHVYPQRSIILDPDPVVDLVYFGRLYFKSVSQFKLLSTSEQNGLVLCRPSFDPIETIQNIINRPHNIIDNQKVIKTVLITVKSKQDDHLALKRQIESHFNSQVMIIIINANTPSLIDEFKKLASLDSTQQKTLAEGVLIIIGMNCFSAGISIKPGVQDQIDFNYNDQNYHLFGLTDQIYKPWRKEGDPRPLETNIQAMRIFGYYPVNYKLTLWIESPDITEFKTLKQVLIEQFDKNDELAKQYQDSPKSIENFQTVHRFDLFASDPYKIHQHKAQFPIQDVHNKHQTYDREIPTEIFPIGIYLARAGLIDKWKQEIGITGELTLADFENVRNSQRGRFQKELKQQIKKLYQQHTDQTLDYEIQVGYTDRRHREIIQSTIYPYETLNSNIFVTGTLKSNTPISQIYLVKLLNPTDDNIHPPDLKYCLQTGPQTWYIIYPENTKLCSYQHKYLNHLGQELSPIHYQVRDKLNHRLDQLKRTEKPQKPYNKFQEWYRSLKGKQSHAQYSQIWCGYTDQQKQLFTQAIKQQWSLETLSQAFNV